MNTHQRFRWIRLASLALALSGAVAFGHHSFAAFDMTNFVTLQGTVKEFQWRNPHSWIQIMVNDASGNPVEWSIEMSSPSGLSRQGWKPKTLQPGDKITIVMHPLRDGKAGGSFVSGTLPDGTRLGGSPTPTNANEP
jgi:hypothetical protein